MTKYYSTSVSDDLKCILFPIQNFSRPPIRVLFGLASAFITGLVSYQGVCYSFISPFIFYSLLVSQIKINITEFTAEEYLFDCCFKKYKLRGYNLTNFSGTWKKYPHA